MKKLCAKAVKTTGDNIVVYISKKERKTNSRFRNELLNRLQEEKEKNKVLNEKLSRLKGENSVLKHTKEILEQEIERLRNFIVENKNFD